MVVTKDFLKELKVCDRVSFLRRSDNSEVIIVQSPNPRLSELIVTIESGSQAYYHVSLYGSSDNFKTIAGHLKDGDTLSLRVQKTFCIGDKDFLEVFLYVDRKDKMYCYSIGTCIPYK